MIIRKPRRMHRNAGLTLMELLISLALLALIAVGISSSLGLAVRIHDRSEAIGLQSGPVLYRIHLRHWLQTATPSSLLTPFPVRFEGAADRLEFFTLAETPQFPQAAALRIGLAAGAGKLALTVTAIADDGSELETLEKTLAEGASDVRFSYLSADQDTSDWLNAWHQDAGLPRAVKITVAPGSTPDWPDFIVRLIYAAPAQ